MTKQQSIDWVVFDVGNVLVTLSKTGVPDAFNEVCGQDVTDRLALLSQEGFFDQFGVGAISTVDAYRTIAERLENNLSPETVERCLLAELLSEKQEVVSIVQALSRQVRLACLSNTIDPHWRYLKESFDIFDHFEHLFASHELRLKKPGPQIFARACEIMSAEPHRCLFIDDIEENVVGARSAGWEAVVFRDGDTLREDLRGYELQV